MQVAELLEQKGHFVATIEPSASVGEAISALGRHGVGALVVSSDRRHVDGIVSERDIVRILDVRGAALLADPVSSIMSHVVHCCAPDDPAESLMAMMTDHRVRHVPVLVDRVLVGIVSIGDVVKWRLAALEEDRDALINYISAR